jgi:uncharacterized protein YyaL (SSP411 family)
MSVWLTPDLRPFYAGTYFPPEDAYGRPGFTTLLAAIDEAWRNRRADIEKSADQITGVLQQLAEPRPATRALSLDGAAVAAMIERSTADFDRHEPKVTVHMPLTTDSVLQTSP